MTEADLAELQRRQDAASAAFHDALAPLIDGKVVIAVDLVIAIQIRGRCVPTRMNMGFNPDDKEMVRRMARDLHLAPRPPDRSERIDTPPTRKH